MESGRGSGAQAARSDWIDSPLCPCQFTIYRITAWGTILPAASVKLAPLLHRLNLLKLACCSANQSGVPVIPGIFHLHYNFANLRRQQFYRAFPATLFIGCKVLKIRPNKPSCAYVLPFAPSCTCLYFTASAIRSSARRNRSVSAKAISSLILS